MNRKVTFYAMWPTPITAEYRKGYERHLCRDRAEAEAKVQGHEDWAIEIRVEGRGDNFRWSDVFTATGHVRAKGAASVALVERLEHRA